MTEQYPILHKLIGDGLVKFVTFEGIEIYIFPEISYAP